MAEREVLYLHYSNRLTYGEIASIIDCHPGHVRHLHLKAIARLGC